MSVGGNLFATETGLLGNMVPGGSNPTGTNAGGGNTWNPLGTANAQSNFTPGGNFDVTQAPSVDWNSLFGVQATPGQSQYGMTSGGEVALGINSPTSGSSIDVAKTPQDLLGYLQGILQSPQGSVSSDFSLGPLGGDRSNYTLQQLIPLIQQLQQYMGNNGAPVVPSVQSAAQTEGNSIGNLLIPPAPAPMPNPPPNPRQPAPTMPGIQRIMPTDGSPDNGVGVPNVTTPPSPATSPVSDPRMLLQAGGGINTPNHMPLTPDQIIPPTGNTSPISGNPSVPSNTPGASPVDFSTTGTPGSLFNTGQGVSSLLGATNVQQLSDQLDKIFGGGVGQLLAGFLTKGAGFNPDSVTAMTNAFAPFEQQGVANIKEAFGANGGRDSSSAALGLSNFERDLTLGEDNIFAQQYQNSVSQYSNMLQSILQNAAADKANQLGPLDYINGILPLLSTLGGLFKGNTNTGGNTQTVTINGVPVSTGGAVSAQTGPIKTPGPGSPPNVPPPNIPGPPMPPVIPPLDPTGGANHQITFDPSNPFPPSDPNNVLGFIGGDPFYNQPPGPSNFIDTGGVSTDTGGGFTDTTGGNTTSGSTDFSGGNWDPWGDNSTGYYPGTEVG